MSVHLLTGEAMQRLPTEDRQRQIADAALKLVAEHGVGGLTIAAIAREVGLAEGTLFRHFGSKQEIADAAVGRMEELLFEGFPPQQGDPLERLGAFFMQRVGLVRRLPGVMRLLLSDELSRAGTEAAAARVLELKRRSMGFVVQCFAEARQRGLVRGDLDPRALALLVNGAALALLQVPAQLAGAISPEDVWASLERLVRT